MNKPFKKGRRVILFFTITSLLLGLLTLISLTMGAAQLSEKETLDIIFFPSKAPSPLIKALIWKVRMPRVFAALIAGGALGLAGAVMQGVLQNPLASPFTLGISSAAGLGASLVIVLNLGILGSFIDQGTSDFLIVSNAFIFAVLAFSLVFLLGKTKQMHTESLILAGIAVMYLFSSMTSFLQFIATNEQLSAIVFWMMGSLSGLSWKSVSIMGGVYAISLPFLLKNAWDLNALSSGRESALSLGINVSRLIIISMIASSLLTASIISFTGVIGFVGLVAPHITRLLIGGDNRSLLIASSLSGSLILLGADTLSRLIIPPSEIPLGIMTSFIGVPFFIYILIKDKRSKTP